MTKSFRGEIWENQDGSINVRIDGVDLVFQHEAEFMYFVAGQHKDQGLSLLEQARYPKDPRMSDNWYYECIRLGADRAAVAGWPDEKRRLFIDQNGGRL